MKGSGWRSQAALKPTLWCDCGRVIHSNIGIASHRYANPDHRSLTPTQHEQKYGTYYDRWVKKKGGGR